MKEIKPSCFRGLGFIVICTAHKIPHTPKSIHRICTGCRRKLNTSGFFFPFNSCSKFSLKAIKHDISLRIHRNEYIFIYVTRVETRSTSASIYSFSCGPFKQLKRCWRDASLPRQHQLLFTELEISKTGSINIIERLIFL